MCKSWRSERALTHGDQPDRVQGEEKRNEVLDILDVTPTAFAIGRAYAPRTRICLAAKCRERERPPTSPKEDLHTVRIRDLLHRQGQLRRSTGNLNFMSSCLSETLLGCPWQSGAGALVERSWLLHSSIAPLSPPRSAQKFCRAREGPDRMVPPAAPFVALLLVSA